MTDRYSSSDYHYERYSSFSRRDSDDDECPPSSTHRSSRYRDSDHDEFFPSSRRRDSDHEDGLFPSSRHRSSRYRDSDHDEFFPSSRDQFSRYQSADYDKYLADVLTEAARLKDRIDDRRRRARITAERFGSSPPRYLTPDDRYLVYEGIVWADKDELMSLREDLRGYEDWRRDRFEGWRNDVNRQSRDERGKFNPRFHSPERRELDADGYYSVPERRDGDDGGQSPRSERHDPDGDGYSRELPRRLIIPSRGGDY